MPKPLDVAPRGLQALLNGKAGRSVSAGRETGTRVGRARPRSRESSAALRSRGPAPPNAPRASPSRSGPPGPRSALSEAASLHHSHVSVLTGRRDLALAGPAVLRRDSAVAAEPPGGAGARQGRTDGRTASAVPPRYFQVRAAHRRERGTGRPPARLRSSASPGRHADNRHEDSDKGQAGWRPTTRRPLGVPGVALTTPTHSSARGTAASAHGTWARWPGDRKGPHRSRATEDRAPPPHRRGRTAHIRTEARPGGRQPGAPGASEKGAGTGPREPVTRASGRRP